MASWIFPVHSSKRSLFYTAWESLVHTFFNCWESKVTMLNKKKVGQRVFSFPHPPYFFFFKCFSSLLFRKAWLKNKSWFLP